MESDRTLLKICNGFANHQWSTVQETIGKGSKKSEYASTQAFFTAGENGMGQRNLATSSNAPAKLIRYDNDWWNTIICMEGSLKVMEIDPTSALKEFRDTIDKKDDDDDKTLS